MTLLELNNLLLLIEKFNKEYGNNLNMLDVILSAIDDYKRNKSKESDLAGDASVRSKRSGV